MRLARFARVRLSRHALPISLLILRKKPTVLQSRVRVKVVLGLGLGLGSVSVNPNTNPKTAFFKK